MIIHNFAGMKFLALILSIYVLALNLVPCEDGTTAENEVQTEISQGMADNGDRHQNTDTCSSFCSCQCCHINATYFRIADLKLDLPYISTQDFLYLNGEEKDFSTSILQPPQV